MEFVYDELDGVWKQVYATYHVESEEGDKRLRETIRRGEHFQWHSAKPEDFDMPEDDTETLVCFSGRKTAVKYDHAFHIAAWYGEESGWELDDEYFNDLKDLTIHGWMPLPDFAPEEEE